MIWRNYLLIDNCCIFLIIAEAVISTNHYSPPTSFTDQYKVGSSASPTKLHRGFNASTFQNSIQMPSEVRWKKPQSKPTLTAESYTSKVVSKYPKVKAKVRYSIHRNSNSSTSFQKDHQNGSRSKLKKVKYGVVKKRQSSFMASDFKKLDALGEPRLLVMTTIGIINSIIAMGAAMSMGGVILTGLLFMVKMAITGMLLTMGWIYVI